VLLLPLALLIGVLWQSNRPPDELVLPPADNREPRPRPRLRTTPKSIPTPKVDVAPAMLPPKLTLFVPNDNAELERKTVDNPVTKSSGSPDKDFVKVADAALALLEKRVPNLFPAGSFVGSVQRDGDVVSVNLSRKWYEMPKWTQGTSNAILAQDAIVNTLTSAAQDESNSIKVRFLQDGKPAELLGELDLTEPVSANTDTVAKG
jgi:hypothetical protein